MAGVLLLDGDLFDVLQERRCIRNKSDERKDCFNCPIYHLVAHLIYLVTPWRFFIYPPQLKSQQRNKTCSLSPEIWKTIPSSARKHTTSSASSGLRCSSTIVISHLCELKGSCCREVFLLERILVDFCVRLSWQICFKCDSLTWSEAEDVLPSLCLFPRLQPSQSTRLTKLTEIIRRNVKWHFVCLVCTRVYVCVCVCVY